jgi:hypothetical protein
VAYVARWAEVASDQYWELAEPVRQLVDERVRNLTEVPDGPSCNFDPHTDHWTATAGDGSSCSCTSSDRSSRGCSSSDWWRSDLALAPYASVAGTERYVAREIYNVLVLGRSGEPDHLALASA